MLILTRREGETVIIRVGGIKIAVVVDRIEGRKVRLGFDAPKDVSVNRMEVQQDIDEENDRLRKSQKPTFYKHGEK